MDRNTWAHYFLDGINAPHNTRNARVLVAWMQTEGGNALWNPLNTTQYEPGCWNYNSVGVKNYPDWATGQRATLTTIEQSCCGYPKILKRLRSRWATAGAILRAIDSSQWGTSGLIERVYPEVKADYWTYASKLIAGS